MGPGWYYCTACKDKFTVRTGTIWERSHIPLHKWLLASRLMASSKKGHFGSSASSVAEHNLQIRMVSRAPDRGSNGRQ
jgi:transposase-like protein